MDDKIENPMAHDADRDDDGARGVTSDQPVDPAADAPQTRAITKLCETG